MNKYYFELPDTRQPGYNVVTVIISIINIIFFLYLLIAGGNPTRWICITGIVAGIAGLLIQFLLNRNDPKTLISIELLFLLTGLLWLISGKLLIGILLSIFAILGYFNNRKKIILISAEGIQYPSFPARLFNWEEVARVILKGDVLSIDLKNNRLLQFTLGYSQTSQINKEEFNFFCAQRISGK